MQLSDLTTYALEQYGITEERKWSDLPGFSALCHPDTKKRIAFLMRQWDTQTGEQIEKCDLRCGRIDPKYRRHSFISEPIRVRNAEWTGISFDSTTDPKIVRELFDKAYQTAKGIKSNFNEHREQVGTEKVYGDTLIKNSKPSYSPGVPHEITEMQRLYDYGLHKDFDINRSANFYNQGKFMEGYTDDVRWRTGFSRYFPTYHDMNVSQLREYFTWRAHYRDGDIYQTATSFAYVHIYELLNQIGTQSPQESLEKMEAFLTDYVDAFGDKSMTANLKKWTLSFIIINGLPKETAIKYIDQKTIERDTAIGILGNPQDNDDNKIVEALDYFMNHKLLKSTIIKNSGEKGKHLVADSWRKASASSFTKIFGRKSTQSTPMLENAVYYDSGDMTERVYDLSPARRYIFDGQNWFEEFYNPWAFQKATLNSFFEAIDIRLRAYLNLRKTKKEFADTHNFLPAIDAAIRDYEESMRPKINVDLASLAQIRKDSLSTRDSLLTEEDMDWAGDGHGDIASPTPPENHGEAIETQILRSIMTGGDYLTLLKANHMMPSIAAEQINEKYFDDFADNIVECDGDRIEVVEDYREELEEKLA